MTLRKTGANALALVLVLAPAAAQIGPPPSSGSGTAPVASVSTTCPTTGPSTGAITLSNAITTNVQTGTSYTVLASDCGKLLTFSNAGAIAVTLPQAGSTGFPGGFYLSGIMNLGAGTATITPTTSTINGAASLALTTGQSVAGPVSDGTNWTAPPGKGGGGGGSGTVNSGTAGQLGIYSSSGTAISGSTPGAGVLTALGIAPGTTGSVLLNGGSLGTPSGGTLTNATGLPIAGISGLGSGWAAALVGTYSTGGGCSGSFCTLTAGSNWTAALTANLGSGWQAAFAATYSSSGIMSDRYLGAKSGFGSSTFWNMDPVGTYVSLSPNATVVGHTYCYPFTVPYSMYLSAIYYYVATIGASGTQTTYAFIYADGVDAANNNWHYPAGPALASVSASNAVVGAVAFTFGTPILFTGSSPADVRIYWKCFQHQDNTAKLQSISYQTTNAFASLVGARTAVNAFAPPTGTAGAMALRTAAVGTFGTAPVTSAATSWVEIAGSSGGIPGPTSVGLISSIP